MHKKSILTLLMSGAALWAPAQDLHKEITVERTVQPDLRDAFRLGGIAPEITLPAVANKALRPAEYTEAGALTHQAAKLPPAPWADSIPRTPYRGYVSAGYLPMYNAGGNAGFTIIDRPGARVGIWAQADAYSYKGDIPYATDMRLGSLIAEAGADASVCLPESSRLKFALRGMGAMIHTPCTYLNKGLQRTATYNQRVASAAVEAGWSRRFGNIAASIGGGWENIRFDHALPAVLKKDYTALNEKVGTINAGVCLSDEFTGAGWLGMDIDWMIQASNVYPDGWYTAARTITEGHFRPYLNFDSDGINGRLGANLSVATGDADKAVKIAPEAHIAYTSDSFAAWARATGGETLNPMSSLFRINQYVAPYLSYGRSNVPFDIRGGLSYGPASGLTLEVNGGYAKARQYLTPLVTIESNGYFHSSFTSTDFGCWYVGGRVAYAYADLFTVAVDLRTGGADNSVNSWYEWRDGAKTCLEASVKVRPIRGLDIEASYLMRTGRKGLTDVYPYNSTSLLVTRYTSDLGDIGSLNLEGSYAVSSRLTAFLSLDNILCKKYLLISGMPAQKLGGLAGITYRF